MANEVLLPKTFVNADPAHGIAGDIADADDFNANNVKLNDKVYVSATAPAAPYLGQFWVKSDEAADSPLLLCMYTGATWKSIQLMDVE